MKRNSKKDVRPSSPRSTEHKIKKDGAIWTHLYRERVCLEPKCLFTERNPLKVRQNVFDDKGEHTQIFAGY